jgi:hypothetical protein
MGTQGHFLLCKILAAKNSWIWWMGIDLWHKIIKEKYFPNSLFWSGFTPQTNPSKNGTIIWKAIINYFHIVGDWLIWKIGNGSKVLIGKDPWIVCSNNHLLPEDLITSLNHRGFYYLNQVGRMDFITGNTRWILEKI